MDGKVLYALSIKQPWAALLVHGLKTVEVRGWATRRRGLVLIHAGRLRDRRAETLDVVPDWLREAAQQVGGIVGSAELTGCIRYRTVEAFTADRARHLNDPSWFRGPKQYGFTFANMTPLPFRQYTGTLFFFPVEQAFAQGPAVLE
jgi:hypothetical protein